MTQIVLNGSHNTNGNTSKLIEKLFPNIKEIKLINYQIELYNYDGSYSNRDQFFEIIDQIIKYDEIIFATPVYWYSMSSILKIFFDRLTDLITINKTVGYLLKNKNIKVITSSNGNNLNENFFLPFIETTNYLGMNFISATHYINEIT